MFKVIEKIARRNDDLYSESPALIAFLGDSVTHGCFDIYMDERWNIETEYRALDGYPAQLQKKLHGLFPKAGCSILNAGISGDSAAGGLKRVENDVLRFRPDLVVVNFGLNDCGGGLEKLDEYGNNMDGIFKAIKASSAEAILLTPNHMCSYIDHRLTDGFLRLCAIGCMDKQKTGVLRAYVERAREVAKQNDVPIADAFKVWEALAASGVDTTALLVNHVNHPNKEMHGVFVNVLMNTLFGVDDL